MQTLITKSKNAISGAVLFAATIAMAGLGFAFLGMLAFFALIGVGVALLAAPFAAMTQDDTDTQTAA